MVQGQERNIDEDYRTAFRFACAQLGGLGERLIALCDFRYLRLFLEKDYKLINLRKHFDHRNLIQIDHQTMKQIKIQFVTHFLAI